ncbi:MAG: M20/M25/M40 family metallo-hydrolase [Elusimicrobia bacterium]|nr:M20/M25/M40 family metallo-hydrolase [Elusimicrobiota bacterium]
MQAPAPTPVDAEVVKLVVEGAKKVYKVQARPVGMGAATVAGHVRHYGFPAVAWCKFQDTAHQPNEYCLLENIIGDAKVFAYAMINAKP